MKKFRIVFVFFSLAFIYILLSSHSDGQATTDNEDDTGSPTAKLCTSCHGGGSYGPVTTTIQVFTHGTTTAITSYQPGTLYDVKVTVTAGTGTPKGYGFEFTGLTTPGNVAISGYTNLATNVKQKTLTTGTWKGRTFTEHNGVTTNNAFDFSWTAPAAGTGTIEFYASGNAVNGDGTDQGDNPSNTSLVVPEILAATGTTTNVLCFGSATGAITLAPVGGTSPYSYNWGSGIISQNRTGLTAGAYTVTVTDNASNSVTETFTITQPAAALSISATPTNVLCFGGNNGAINITVSGGTSPYTYNWGASITSQNRTSLTAGNYSVIVTDKNSCTTSQSFTIAQPAAQLTVTGTVTGVLCYGANTGAINITANGGTSSYSYNWGNNITSQNRSSIAAGNYAITVTDINQCTATNSFTITQPSAALSVTGTTVNVLCSGGGNGSIQLNPSGGTPSYSYNWSGNITTENRDSLVSGNYSVTVKDNNGCADTSSFTISQPSKLIVSDTVGTIACFGETTSININANGGISPYTGTGSFTVPAGAYNYTITDANGCASTTSAVIPQPTKLVATAGTVTISCNGDSGIITVSATGGTLPYTGTGNFTVNSPGSYTYTVTDSNGCSANATGTALASSGLTDTFNIKAPICPGSCNGSISVFVTGGALPYSFTWSDSTNAQSDTALCAGNYQQTITDSTGCSLINNYVIPAIPAIQIGFTSDSIYCFGDSSVVSVNVSGGTEPYTYEWSSGQTQGDINVPAGGYSLSVTDNHQCAAADSLIIYQPPKLSVSGTTTSAICFGFNGGTITTSVNGGVLPYKFNWNNDSTGMNITRLIAGNYAVTVMDNNTCTTSSSFNITQPDSLFINVISVTNDTDGRGGVIDVSANGGTPPYNYSWENGSEEGQGNNLSNLGPGTYSIYVIDSNGCSQINNIVIAADTTTGIIGLQMDDIRLYPNPVTDKLLVHLPAFNVPVQLQLFSVEGTVVKSEKLTGGDNWLDVSGLPPALYIVEINAGNVGVKFKVLKME